MSNELKSTFSDLSADEFRAYAEDLVEAYPSAAERQRLQAYMFQIIAQDKAASDVEQSALNTKRSRRLDHREILDEIVLLHAHDYSRFSALFTDVVKTDQEILD